MSTGQGYSITTYRFRLRCGHPEWLIRTQELYDQIVKFYYDLLLEHEELWEKGSQETLRSLEYLSLPGREKRNPQTPLPWEDLPPYFRRAAINAGIAAAKSFLARTKELNRADPEAGMEGEKQSFSSVNNSEKERHSIRSGKTPAEEIHSAVVYYSRMYRELSSEHITLKVWDGENWNWMGCRLSGREFPPVARVLSPSVSSEGPFLMLHVPVREPVEDISPVKERMRDSRNICGVQFTNGDAFAVASICNGDGRELAVKFFNGGGEYAHHCEKVLAKIRHSSASLGDSPEGLANKKYWMHLKHLREHYAHRVSREIVRFCEQNQAGLIVLPKYNDEYVRNVMSKSGRWSPLYLSFRIRSYLRYKAWKSGIIVIETYASGTGTVCALCGQPLEEEEGRSKEYVCRMGHRGNRYLNTARNLTGKCLRQFRERESG